MDSVEAEGLSIDEAIENALATLSTTRDRVDIEIVENAARGLFGIGGRKARVRATLRPPIDAQVLGRSNAAVEAPARKEAAASKPAATVREPQVSREMVERAQNILQEIVSRVGVDAGVAVKEEEGHTILDITGDTSGVLIGRRGQMLDALEYIVNRIVIRDSSSPARFIIDSQDYRARHRKSLEDLARRMGEQAKKKRKPLTLNPLGPRDRRIVHLALQDDPTLTTHSSGDGYFRKVVIIPAGAAKTPRRDA